MKKRTQSKGEADRKNIDGYWDRPITVGRDRIAFSTVSNLIVSAGTETASRIIRSR